MLCPDRCRSRHHGRGDPAWSHAPWGGGEGAGSVVRLRYQCESRAVVTTVLTATRNKVCVRVKCSNCFSGGVSSASSGPEVCQRRCFSAWRFLFGPAGFEASEADKSNWPHLQLNHGKSHNIYIYIYILHTRRVLGQVFAKPAHRAIKKTD